MRRYLIHLQAIYPAVLSALFTFTLTFALLYFVNPQYTGLLRFIIIFGTLWTLLFSMDAVQRFKHYRSAVAYLKHPDASLEKLLEHEQIAWCTRESAKAACRQHSEKLYQEAICYYVNKGIYYYHIFPEKMFTRQSPLFDPLYWRIAFFDLRPKDYLSDLHPKEIKNHTE